MISRRIDVLFFLATIFMVQLLNAQSSDLRQYSVEQGLPQSQVHAIAQDSIGFLWLGTQGGGLARFDGENFKVFSETNGLSSNYIHSIYAAKDSLFIGSKRGLSLKTKAGFQNFSCPQVNDIFSHGKRTFLSTNQGIYEFQKSGKLRKITLNQAIDQNVVNAMLFDGKSFWIATDNGLFNSDKLQDDTDLKSFGNQKFTSLAFSEGKLMASSFSDGIVVIDLKTNETQWIENLRRINSISVIDNQLWVATDFEGVTILDTENFQIQKELNARNGLQTLDIRAFLVDNQNTIWIGSSGGGFYKYYANDFTHFDEETGLKGNRIYAVLNHNDQMYVSMSEAGLARIDSLGIHQEPKIKGFENVAIKTVAIDDNNDLWLGSDGKGLVYQQKIQQDSLVLDMSDFENIKADTVKVQKVKNHILNTANGFPSNWIRTIVPQNDTIWVATNSDGIVKIELNDSLQTYNISKVFDKTNGIEDISIRTMKLDSSGKLWYGTQSGHLGYFEKGVLMHLGKVLDENTSVNSLIFNDNNIFLGTSDAGIWYSAISGGLNFKQLSGEKPLSSNNVNQLIFDSEIQLWVGSEKGVDKVILDTENRIVDVFHFGRNDGFLGVETNLNAVDKDKNGNLWFGTMNGLTKYDASIQPENSSAKPKITFETIEVDYKPADSVGSYKSNVLQLPSHENQIAFSYRSVDLGHPNGIEYRYRLNDNSWSPWTSNYSQNLAGLSYGKHEFFVQSRNFRWQESEVISFPFSIETPLHQKAWFQWLMIAVGLFIILLFGWIYFRNLKRKNQKEKQRLEMENHLLKLEHKALQLQMNPHFIFNVLNGIKAMSTTNPDKMNTTVNTFAVLLREVLNNSRKDSISLEQEIKTLKNYIEIEQLMASKPFTFDIQTDTSYDPEEILIQPMLIQPFVENAIRHGILKSSRDGELKIHFKTIDDTLECVILDNGLGIFHTQKTKQNSDHQSLALTVTKERIESLSGKNALQIKEIKSNDKILGTEIRFRIPLRTDF